MACPLGYGSTGPKNLGEETAEKRDNTVKQYTDLLPSCGEQQAVSCDLSTPVHTQYVSQELDLCRERVAQEAKSFFTQKVLWRLGFGRGHCTPEMEVSVDRSLDMWFFHAIISFRSLVHVETPKIVLSNPYLRLVTVIQNLMSKAY